VVVVVLEILRLPKPRNGSLIAVAQAALLAPNLRKEEALGSTIGAQPTLRTLKSKSIKSSKWKLIRTLLLKFLLQMAQLKPLPMEKIKRKRRNCPTKNIWRK